MHSPTRLLALVLLVAPAPAAHAGLVARYDFAGKVGTEASVAAAATGTGVTGVDLTRGAGLVAEHGLNSFNSRSFTSSSTGGTLAQAVAAADYLQFGFATAAGKQTDLTGLAFTSRRSATGPTGFEVRYSTDGFSTFAVLTSYSLSGTDNVRTTLDTSSVAGLQDLTGTVLFRIYGYGSTNGNGTYRLGVDGGPTTSKPANLELSGTVASVVTTTAVPGPGVLAIGLAGAAGLAVVRRRFGRTPVAA